MFCGRCGSGLGSGARFCSACGAPVAQQPVGNWTSMPVSNDPLTRLQRPRATRMVAGVCAGLARQYGWDLTWVRVLTVLISVFSSGAGVVAYIVFWIVMPEEPWLLQAPLAPASAGTSSVAGQGPVVSGPTESIREV